MVREVVEVEREEFDKLASHPLQSWSWGEFREKTGVEVFRLGRYREEKGEQTMVESAQVTFHKIPYLPWRIGYWPKGLPPSNEIVEAVLREAGNRRAVMVTMEPNLLAGKKMVIDEIGKKFVMFPGRPLFTKWSFWLDLNKSEEELMEGMKSKTRYNVRYAERQGVKVVEDNSELAFEEYWKLTEETTKRQGFYAHSRKYHELMFKTMKEAGIAHLFRAVYKNKTLVSWIVFILNGVIYYPYGASTREYREVYPSDAMMWAVIKWGKKQGAEIFDMWGSPGPDPKPGDSWFGFHRFKMGFGAELVEFVGTYDLVVSRWFYPIYRIGNELRWGYLRLKKK
mgnify:CR=1 FL=1